MTLTLSGEEIMVLFPLLKKNETTLSARERNILVRIEKILYEHLSIEEIESHVNMSPKLC